MRTDTLLRTDQGNWHPRPWTAPLVAAALALCTTAASYAQVAAYSLEYAKRLQTSSVLVADENAAFEPITGGTVLASGTQAATESGTVFGIGYTAYSGTAIASWQGNASYVGTPNATDAVAHGDAQFDVAGAPVAKYGPGYPIGFDFTFNNEVFDRVGISGQGWIGFGKSASLGNADPANAVAVYTARTASANYLPLNNTTLLQNDSRRNRVVATGGQGGTENVGTTTLPILFASGYNQYPGAELRYETIGTAPNRVFVVQWLSYGFKITNADHQYYRRMDFQIRLSEGTNKVEVRFGKAWRSNTTSSFQTGLGGKTGGAGPAGDFSSFGLYDPNTNEWRGWPYAFTAQANHSGYPGSTDLGQRIPWDGVQGYYPHNYYGTGSAEEFYEAIFTHIHSNAGTGPNAQNMALANRTISGTKANTPDMMGFIWTPSACTQLASNLSVAPSFTSATLSWTGTGDFDYAIGTGNNPSTATFTGTVTGSSVNVPGLTGSTNYKAWVRTNCGGGNTSLWLPAVAFNTVPCPAPAFYYGVYPISRVQFNFLDNSSSADPIYDGADPARYQDFTSMIADVEPNMSYTLTVTGYTGGSAYATAYVDWDQDGVFEANYPLNGGSTYASSATVSITVPPAAPSGHCRMRVVQSNDYAYPTACNAGMYYGQVEDYMLNVPIISCPPPTGLAASNVAVHSANLGWNASVNSTGYLWEVRTSGAAGSGATGLVASGNAAGTSASVSGLISNTSYNFYVRSDCGDNDLSSWMSGSFKTILGCGDTWDSPGGYNTMTDAQYIQTYTICPENAGDVVTLAYSHWGGLLWYAAYLQRSAVLIYDGDDTNAPMISGTGTGYNETGWNVPAGGWVTQPPIITSTAASGCITVKVMSYGTYVGSGYPNGFRANMTCAPRPTCFAPTATTVTSTTVHEANFTWNSGDSPNVEWIVVTNGGTPVSPVLFTGTSASSSATATGLAANTQYTAYFRGLCDDEAVGDDPSTWTGSGLNFKTKIGCGGAYDLYSSSAYAAYPAIKDSVITICPDNVGDVVTLTTTKFSFGGDDQGLVGLFVHNGNSTAAPLFNSGRPAKTSGAYTMAAGAYWGNVYRYTPGNPTGTLPGPFTSTHASGCLTLHFMSRATSTYDQGMQSQITCGPAPACSTPDAVSVSAIGTTNATVSWSNTTEPCIIEYGPAGFTPGTGATAGTNGTVVSGVTSPAIISGLSTSTAYDVYVRQVCDGPSYSANSFKAWFSTSMDCSTATVLSCGSNQVQAFDGSAGSAAYHSSQFTGAPTCFAGYSAVTGQTFLYRITADLTGDYQLNFNRTSGTGNVYFLTTPVENGCGASAFTCVGGSYYIQPPLTYPTAQASGSFTFHLEAGDHYILMKGNAEAKTVSFNVLCPGIPACVPAPTFPVNGNAIAVNTNAITFTWPAAFGAASYDVYFQGSFVANTPTNSINGGSGYTSANMAALYGAGATITWRVVPKNDFGIASCPTNWTFSIGGNGGTNAIPLTNGVAKGGNVFTANGYSSLNGDFWGNDSWFKFTASTCADSAEVSLCLPSTEAANYLALQVRRASDNALVFPPTNDATFYAYVASGGCFKYEWFDYDVWNWVQANPKFAVTPGETYYVIADGYNYGYNFTMAYNEVVDATDTDGDGITDCMDSCPETPGVEGAPCYAGPLFTSAVIEDCQCVGSGPVPCSNDLTLEFQTDGNPWETTWELVEQGTNFVVQQGGPMNAEDGIETNDTCLPDGCFYLRVLDEAGDGMTTGGYILRTTGSNQRIIDNRNNFSTGYVSQAAQGFCLPISTTQLIYSSCDKLDWVANKFIVVAENAAVSAQYGVNNANSGYEFWFFNPNGGYSFRRFRSHATSDGYGTGALRANHFKVNGWTNSVATPHIPLNTLLNVRVRGRVAGTNLEFGPACQFKMDAALAACPRVKLQDDPANTADYSCGVTRNFGGSSNANNRITANPPQPIPTVASSSVRYQFRFRIAGESICIVRPAQTSARLVLNWTNGPALQATKTYEVDVRVSLDGGATWCFGPATADQAAACADTQDWGKVCLVTIGGSGQMQGGSSSLTAGGNSTFTMYPNPNRGDQLFVSIGSVERGVSTVSVDIFDLTGKKVTARTIAVQDGFVNTALDLNGDLANGMYLVNVTAGSTAYTERLVIQH